MVSDKPKEGFIRTVDINIVIQDYSFPGSKYWNNMQEVLKNNIKSKAIKAEWNTELPFKKMQYVWKAKF